MAKRGALARMKSDEITKLEPLTVTVREARRLTGLGNTTIYRLLGEGKLRRAKVGTRTLVVYSTVKALLEGAELRDAAPARAKMP
jgi:excisionase family DNA binding protein